MDRPGSPAKPTDFTRPTYMIILTVLEQICPFMLPDQNPTEQTHDTRALFMLSDPRPNTMNVPPPYNRKPDLFGHTILPQATSVKKGVHKYSSHTSWSTNFTFQ